MAAQSTLRLAVLRDRRCWDVVHSFTGSCARFYLAALRRSAVNTAGLFAPLYCLLERILLVGERETGLLLTPARLTYLFMASSGALLYFLRQTDFRNLLQSVDTPWFFYPPSMEQGSKERGDNASQRLHKEVKATGRLLAAGFALQMLRVTLKNVRRPAAIAGFLRRFDTYRLSLFLGGYSLLYKACTWMLERARGRDAAWHAVPAGLLAGAALRLYPQRTLALLATTTLMQILLKRFCKKKGVKNIQVWKYIFVSLSAGYLVHSYYADPDHCPIWFNGTVATVTGGIAPELRQELLKIWHPFRFPAVVGGL
ncbi:uncharacterized protein GBIM_18191 [Gryllus bimaculatus]|nr:uncharacterized protein GBIM_18191 [Gryllus bimaculatus]